MQNYLGVDIAKATFDVHLVQNERCRSGHVDNALLQAHFPLRPFLQHLRRARCDWLAPAPQVKVRC